MNKSIFNYKENLFKEVSNLFSRTGMITFISTILAENSFIHKIADKEGLRVRNRWVVLGAGVLIQTILGGIYAWSTFIPWLNKTYGLSTGQCGFIFGMTIATFTVAMTFAGRILTLKGPRVTAGISAALFMSGYLLASVSNGSFPLLLISLGGIAGAGIGFGYVCPLSVGMKWFPEKKGLVTGVAVAGFGGGAILLSSVAGYFLHSGVDVLVFFRWLGLFSGLILFVASLFLIDPPSQKDSSIKTSPLSGVFSLPFGIIVLGMFAGTFAGLLIIGNLTPIVTMAGLTEGQAVLSVSLFAVGNALGRISWGYLFDHYGYRCIPLSLGIFALLSFVLLISLPVWLLFLVVSALGFGFGANFVVYASGVSRFFGPQLFPRLYPICFLAYGLAGIIGPGIGGFLADFTGSYNGALYVSGAIVIMAGVFSFMKLSVFFSKEEMVHN
jgi:OFA family oxalate/formate antiporter-like MFS transporter